jgi:hypothetical protein
MRGYCAYIGLAALCMATLISSHSEMSEELARISANMMRESFRAEAEGRLQDAFDIAAKMPQVVPSPCLKPNFLHAKGTILLQCSKTQNICKSTPTREDVHEMVFPACSVCPFEYAPEWSVFHVCALDVCVLVGSPTVVCNSIFMQAYTHTHTHTHTHTYI